MCISIIVPVFNRSKIVTKTLDSIMAQTLNGFELIIVDNNSTDNSISTIKEYFAHNVRKDVAVKILSEPIPGATAARNKGLSEASNDWILFFDSDDIMEPNLLESCCDKINDSQANPDIIYIPTDTVSLNGTRKVSRKLSHDLLELQILHATFYTIAFMVHKDLIDKSGEWDVSLLGWNDWEFGIRLLLNHRKVVAIPSAPLAHHICYANSITGTGYAEKWNIWEKSIDKVETTIKQSNIANKNYYLLLVAYRRLALAGLCNKEKSPQGTILYAKAMKNIASYRWLSPMFALLYHYISMGGVGGSHIAKAWIRLFLRRK